MTALPLDEAQAAVNALAWKMKAPTPVVLRARRNCWRSTYFAPTPKHRSGRIRLAPDAGIESVLHEFAHHMTAKNRHTRAQRRQFTGLRLAKGRRYYGGYRGQGERSVHHGPAFTDALIRVATVWYGDPAQYAWWREYASVKKEWERVLD